MEQGTHHGHGGVIGHVAPLGLYFAVFGALLVLTGLTVAVAYADLGTFNTVVALGIAFVKATLVALFFMHLWWTERLNALGVLAALGFLVLLLAVTLGDYMSRGWMGGS